jgi:hypothetical protein
MSNLSTDDPARAWHLFCDRLATLVDQLGDTDPPGSVRNLARQVGLALEEQFEHADPRHPSFQRFEEPWSQWGAPNPDNLYLRTAIDPQATYRIWADVTGVREVLFSIVEGDMPFGENGVFAERRLSELTIDGNGSFELIVAPDEHPSNWLPTDPRARIIQIRQYQYDWDHDPIAAFRIERTDLRGVPAPPPQTPDVVAALDRVATWLERSLPYWATHGDDVYRSLGSVPNEVVFHKAPPGGAHNIRYGNVRLALAPSEALLLTTDVPDADYWTWVAHGDLWWDSGDFASRQTSLNHTQAHRDTDGLIRIVASNIDPGAPNWIDTSCAPGIHLGYRLIGARSEPQFATEVLAIKDLRAKLPDDHPVIDEATRRDQLARRRAAVLARYV